MNCQHLIRILKEKRWDEIEKIIEENDMLEIQCDQCSKRHSLLHLVCRHQPPLFIINPLIAETQKSCLESDCQGRLPLHVAIRNKASHHVILTLLMQYKEAASIKDNEGKYPLHLLFENCNENVSSRKGKLSYTKQQISDIDLTFRYICKVAPETILIEDDSGVSPIEYAIENEVDMGIIRRMGRVAHKVNVARAKAA